LDYFVMLSYFQAIVLGLLQGSAELFAISSLGRTVLVPAILGWRVERSSDEFVAFVVLTHLATALVLLGFFWRDWLRIVSGVLRSLKQREVKPDDAYAKLDWLLVVSTIPAGIRGLLFEERLKQVFVAPTVVAVVLVLNGAVLYAVVLLRTRDAGEARTMTGRLPVCRGRKPLPLA
jgi:undecaprenyl-diphosphatase